MPPGWMPVPWSVTPHVMAARPDRFVLDVCRAPDPRRTGTATRPVSPRSCPKPGSSAPRRDWPAPGCRRRNRRRAPARHRRRSMAATPTGSTAADHTGIDAVLVVAVHLDTRPARARDAPEPPRSRTCRRCRSPTGSRDRSPVHRRSERSPATLRRLRHADLRCRRRWHGAQRSSSSSITVWPLVSNSGTWSYWWRTSLPQSTQTRSRSSTTRFCRVLG